jgi:hypothetical protein
VRRRPLLDDLARGRWQAMAQHDHAVGLVAPEHLRVALLAVGLMLGIAQQHRIADRLRGLLRPCRICAKNGLAMSGTVTRILPLRWVLSVRATVLGT